MYTKGNNLKRQKPKGNAVQHSAVSCSKCQTQTPVRVSQTPRLCLSYLPRFLQATLSHHRICYRINFRSFSTDFRRVHSCWVFFQPPGHSEKIGQQVQRGKRQPLHQSSSEKQRVRVGAETERCPKERLCRSRGHERSLDVFWRCAHGSHDMSMTVVPTKANTYLKDFKVTLGDIFSFCFVI